MTINFLLLRQHMAICRLGPDEKNPVWAQKGDFTAWVRTPDELSVVCDERSVPDHIKVEKGWRIFMVQGPLEFTQIGVLAGISKPLADAGVSIFVISTFDTDYILVKDNSLRIAITALQKSGYGIEVS